MASEAVLGNERLDRLRKLVVQRRRGCGRRNSREGERETGGSKCHWLLFYRYVLLTTETLVMCYAAGDEAIARELAAFLELKCAEMVF